MQNSITQNIFAFIDFIKKFTTNYYTFVFCNIKKLSKVVISNAKTD